MLNIVCGCTCEVSLDGVWPQQILRYVVDTDECLSVVMLSLLSENCSSVLYLGMVKEISIDHTDVLAG